ncbi:lysosomal dipeptide transporter MFSD1-like [Amphiura filiformis]|uniref:lysosomal dipeptide transporter MFSD1-like n=1 Tax=Amphiura filiformis TaxID=82378 RepID=UPI003B2220BE
MACMHASKAYYRFVVLFFNCMLTFGTYFCFDMPSVLQDDFQKKNCTNNNSTACKDNLGLSVPQYNLLYAIYAWTNAVVVIGAGFLIDKLGNRVGLFLFSGLCLLGSSLFAVGAMLKGTSAMFPVMLIGRLLFGSGNGSLTIVQNRITAYWFREKELAFAFGVTLTFSRSGSVLNFFLTKTVEDRIGLSWTLWGGAFLCLLGFVAAILTSVLDVVGVKQLGQENRVKQESKRLRFQDIARFTLPYWLVTLTIMFFYNGVFPFIADASEFIKDKYGYDDGSPVPSYIAGSVYDVSLVLSPFLGLLIDIIGMRGFLALFCSILTIPVFGLLAFTTVHPLVSTLWLGFTYSFAAASLWPSIPLVVSQATVGTAMGITTSVQMIGIGICNLVIGEVVEHSGWKYAMIFLFFNTLCCAGTAVILNIADQRRGRVLNQSRRQRRQQMESLEHSIQSPGDDSYEYQHTASDYDPLIKGSVNASRSLYSDPAKQE